MAYSLSPWLKPRFFITGTNRPLAGGLMYTYKAGTTDNATTYSDDAGTTNTNPIVLDSDGQCDLFLDDAVSYRIILKNSAGVTQFDKDRIASLGSTQVQSFNSIAALRLRSGTTIANSAKTLGYYAAGDGGGNSFYWDGTSTATVNTGTVIKPTAVSGAGRWLAVDTSCVSLKQCGAKGDGSNCDDAWSVFCNLEGDGVIEAGSYAITKHVTISSGVLKTIRGIGNPTISITLPIDTNFLTCNRQVHFEHVKFDFNDGYVKTGISYAANLGEIILKDVTFKNVKDLDDLTGTILINVNADNNKLYIDGIRFIDVLKKGNGTITDSAGSLNCIYIGGSTGYTLADIRNVYAYEIHNIDALNAIIYEDTAVIYVITSSSDQRNVINIENVMGYNFGKRLIKSHASNVCVRNVIGNSPEGDSLGLVTFLNAQGLGEKYGCIAENCHATGKMEVAFAAFTPEITYRNISATVTAGTKTGMSNAGVGLMVLNSNCLVDGYVSGSERDIGIGSDAVIIKNTTLKNITLNITNNKIASTGIYDLSSSIGLDGLLIDGLTVNVATGSTWPAALTPTVYMNGTTKKARNVAVNNVVVNTLGVLNSQFCYISYTENLTVNNIRYLNTSGLSHSRVIEVFSCANTKISDVVIEGVNTVGVWIRDCTGRNSVDYVQNASASTAAVYNYNSTDFIASNCDYAKVLGTGTATTQMPKCTVGTTANRPITGLVAGFSQHIDTTLGKPIWWNGSVWKDATNTTV